MRANVPGRVRNTNLPKSKPLLPLFEAVVNALHAIEDAGGQGHKITISAERQGSLDEGKPGPFEAFTITDTGIGFTDENFLSFDTVDSTYKLSRGGKGLGRFIWLRAFDRVEVDSHFRSGGGYLRREFTFVARDEDLHAIPVPSDRRSPLTTVRLIGFRLPFRDECPHSLETIAQRLVGHFLPVFLDPNGPMITLDDKTAAPIDLRALFREHFQAFATEHTFAIGDQTFTLSGFRLQGAIAERNEVIYAAAFREVITEHLARYLPNLRNKLVDSDRGTFAYLAFVQSPFLNARVNNERTDFCISREPPSAAPDATTDLLADDISLKTIRDGALAVIVDDLQPYFDEINTSKEALLSNYIDHDAPQYRALLRHKAEFIDQIPPGASKAELDTALHHQLYQRQVKLKQEGQRILAESDAASDGEEFHRRFEQYISDENEIGKTALAQYVVHRRTIVELLDRALSRDGENGRYGLEKTVHSLVFPMRSTSDDVPFEQQNLWIIDERLTFHSFLSSDKPLSTAAPITLSSASRPDILIFNRTLAFSEGEQPLTSLVVIEFKRPMRQGYPDEDPVFQVYRMVREIRSGQSQDNKGQLIRPLTQNVPAYCYIVCDLTASLETRLQDMSALRTPDNLGYYGYNPTLNAYYEVISYAKLLRDAKKRNRILFEKLNLPTTH
jgi:hypothetical protein